MFYLEKLKKEEWNVPKDSRRKETVKMRTETKDNENRKTAKKSQWNKKLVLRKKINKIDHPLAELTQKKRHKSPLLRMKQRLPLQSPWLSEEPSGALWASTRSCMVWAVVRLYYGILLSSEKEWPIDTLKKIMLSEKKPVCKGCTLHDFTCIASWGWWNYGEWGTDPCTPWGGRRGEMAWGTLWWNCHSRLWVVTWFHVPDKIIQNYTHTHTRTRVSAGETWNLSKAGGLRQCLLPGCEIVL